MAHDKEFEAPQGYTETKDQQYLRLRLATITRVDWSKHQVDISYKQETGGRSEVMLTTAYWSPRAFMGAMPEIGASCVVGFYHHGADVWMPFILSYLPAGLFAARRGEAQYIGVPSEGEEDLRERSTRVVRGRLRKIYPGQILLQSAEGSDVVLSDDVHLSNANGNEFTLRSDDGMAVTNAYGTVVNTPGYRSKAGPTTRNHYVIDDHIYNSGDSLVDASDFDAAVSARLIRPVVLSNGKKVNYVCSLPLSPDEGGLPYTEVRTEVDEFSPLEMRYTEDTNLFADAFTASAAIIEHVQGTLIGNNPDDPDTYGRPLKARVFKNLTDSTGSFEVDQAVHSRGLFSPNELQSEAVADYLRVGNYRRAITKTGNVYLHVPRSGQAGPAGDGHSVHARLDGALKMSVGAEGALRNSIYLSTQGSLKMVLGRGAVNAQKGELGRSLDLVTAGATSMEFKGSDDNEVSLRMRVLGKKDEEIGRDHVHTTKGNYELLVHGAFREKVLGKKQFSVTGDWHNTIGGDWKNVLTGSIANQIGTGRSVTIATPGTGINADSLTILAGGRIATLLLGNDLTTLTAGNMLDTIAAGNKITTIGTGTYTVTVGAGAVTVSTAAGAVAISTAAGALSLAASGLVQITGGIVNVTGGLVNLGVVPAGGVVTSAHPCLVTGLPHIGSTTVRASL